MEIQTKDTQGLISNALNRMPNFSDEIQANNVLSKRIAALKSKDSIKGVETKVQTNQAA